MSAQDPSQLLYTAAQASERIGRDEHGRPIKSARWLLDMARAGCIGYRRIGKSLCFSEQDLRDLVEKGYIKPPNARAA